MRNKQKGFSLIELLIVVAIILIIAAIAIPNLLRAKMAANEASAVGSLRTINTSCVEYSTTYGVGFPPSLASLGGTGTATSASAGLIDSVLSGGVKSGYNFAYTPGTADSCAACRINSSSAARIHCAAATRRSHCVAAGNGMPSCCSSLSSR